MDLDGGTACPACLGTQGLIESVKSPSTAHGARPGFLRRWDFWLFADLALGKKIAK